MIALMMLGLAGCERTPAPTPEPPPLTLSMFTPLPTATHAGSVPVRELVWPTASQTEAHVSAFCDWRRGEADTLALDQGAFVLALLEVAADGSLRLGGAPITAEALESGLSEGVARWSALNRACLELQGGIGRAREPELALAAAPAAPVAALLGALRGAARAGVHRIDVLVDAPPGERLPGRTDEQDLQIHLTRTALRKGDVLVPLPDGDRPLPVAALGIDAERIACGLLSVSIAQPWQETVSALDRLAAVGARRATTLFLAQGVRSVSCCCWG